MEGGEGTARLSLPPVISQFRLLHLGDRWEESSVSELMKRHIGMRKVSEIMTSRALGTSRDRLCQRAGGLAMHPLSRGSHSIPLTLSFFCFCMTQLVLYNFTAVCCSFNPVHSNLSNVRSPSQATSQPRSCESMCFPVNNRISN
jgi:hypothetical protein